MSANLPPDGLQSTRNFQGAMGATASSRNFSVFCQISFRENQSFDTLTLRERVHDLGYVRQCDSAVKEMVRLDQNRHAARALIATAAGTDALCRPGERGGEELIFQCLPDFC